MLLAGIIIGALSTLLVEFILAVIYGVREYRRKAAQGMNSVEHMGETMNAVLTNERGEKHVVS